MVDHWWLFSSEGAHGEDCQGGELPSPAGDIRCWSEAEPVLVVTTRDHIHDKLRGCGVDLVHLTYTPCRACPGGRQCSLYGTISEGRSTATWRCWSLESPRAELRDWGDAAR